MNETITNDNQNVNMTLSIQNYIINATSNIIYTLPLISCDGISFTCNRVDQTNNTCNIITSGSNNISEREGIFNSSIQLTNGENIEFISLGNTWQVVKKTKITSRGSAVFSIGYVNNNGSNSIFFTTSGLVYVCVLPFPGTNLGFTFDTGIVTLGTSNATSNFSAKILNTPFYPSPLNENLIMSRDDIPTVTTNSYIIGGDTNNGKKLLLNDISLIKMSFNPISSGFQYTVRMYSLVLY